MVPLHVSRARTFAQFAGAAAPFLSLARGEQAILSVNGVGGAPTHEPYQMVTVTFKALQGAGAKVVRRITGSRVTSLEMAAGCSITVTAVDAQTLALWDGPVHTAALRWGMRAPKRGGWAARS